MYSKGIGIGNLGTELVLKASALHVYLGFYHSTYLVC